MLQDCSPVANALRMQHFLDYHFPPRFVARLQVLQYGGDVDPAHPVVVLDCRSKIGQLVLPPLDKGTHEEKPRS